MSQDPYCPALCGDLHEGASPSSAESLSRDDFRAIADLAGEGLLVLDGSRRVRFANARAARLLKTTPEALTGGTLCDVLAPCFDQAARLHPATAETDQLTAHTLEVVRGDGTRGWVSMTRSVFPSASGDALNLLRISEIGGHELSLQVGFHALDSMAEGIAILDRSGTYLFMNTAHAAMYGYEPGELNGLTWRELYDVEEQRVFEATAFPAMAREGRWSGETYGRLKDGRHSRFWISLSVSGDFMVCCCHDVSEMFRQRAEMSEVHRSLDDANAELRRAGRLKDEFLARVSHELRSPLHAILGAAELLEAVLPTDADTAMRSTFATLNYSANHLRRLIDDLLDVSMAVSKRIDLNLSAINGSHLLASAVMLVLKPADEKRIRITSRVDPPDLVFAADERRILQILLNLLTNAVEYTPPGGQIYLTLRQVGGDTQLGVEDSGCGIASGKLDMLFQMFHQIDGSLARSHEGTGLGLFIVRELAELHGGSVRVESEVGRGTRFTVHIPARPADATEL